MTTTQRRSLDPTSESVKNRLGAILFGLAMLIAAAAQAAGVVGTGTAASCTDAALNTALSGGGVVTFDCGAAPVTITTLTTKVIAASTSIDGGNLITLSGNDTHQVLNVNGAFYLGLFNLNITHGNAGFGSGQAIATLAGSTLQMTNVSLSLNGSVGGGGSALLSQGATVIENCTFTSNPEGAIGLSAGTMRVTNSTFSDNHNTGFDGAAIAVIGGAATLTVNGSTFTNNTTSTGAFGGGAFFNQGTATIINSTFTGNGHSAHVGGAIYSMGAASLVTLLNVTLSGNSAIAGGGFAHGTGNSVTNNSIFANNTPNNCSSSFTNTSSYNLSGDASCDFVGGTGNLSNTNPLLTALASNGGPTQTMALNPGSPAIDAGSPTPSGGDACATVDQRNAARPQGSRCDIGAFEAPGANCTLDIDGNHSVDALTDGLIIIRAMFGLTGTPVTTGAVGAGASRTTWAQIQPYLNGNCGASFAQ